jgi:transglutaminase-like putative cysteine protease
MFLSLRSIDGPYNGLGAKVKFIKSCYAKTLTDPRLRRFAEQAAGRGTRLQQAQRLFNTMREVFVYTADPVGVEYTKSPLRHLDDIQSRGRTFGDCDDQACFGYSALMSIGIPAKLRVTWYNKPMPQHIYLIAKLGNSWYPFDTTRASGFGTEKPYTKAKDF